MSEPKPIPAGFAADATAPIPVLEEKYNASAKTIMKWRRGLGVFCRTGRKPGPQGKHGGRYRGPVPSYYEKDAADICLNCTLPTCSGDCERVRLGGD